MRILGKILVNAVAVWVATALVNGIDLTGHNTGSRVLTLIVVALIFGLVNTVIKPVVKLLAFPVLVLTLGLFTLVINALMLWLTSWLSGALDLDFEVHGFWTAVLGALIISVVSWILHMIIPDRDKERD